MNWIIVFIALAGVVLNIRRKWYCFVFWSASNSWWLVHNICIGEYAQAALFGLFLMFCIYGGDEWERRAKARKREERNRRLTRSTIILFCKRILGTKSNLSERPGSLNVNWLIKEARDILMLLGDEKDKEFYNNGQ